MLHLNYSLENQYLINYNGDVEIDEDKVATRMRKSVEKYNEKIRQTRKRVFYKNGDAVFTRNFDQDKVKSKWNGPYKIIKVSNRENNVYVDKGNKIMRVSIKNIKPCLRGEDVVCNEVAQTVIKLH
ncbi:hypothetical protein EQH57_0153 [Dictyocoela roeselum]|nr:hypothetical protein EQH57_0153 [Dictyocoela roeselum]